MKRTLLTAFAAAFFMAACNNQHSNENSEAEVTATETPAVHPESNLSEEGTQKLVTALNDYYALKDALVATKAADVKNTSETLRKSTEEFRSFLETNKADALNLISYVDTVLSGSKEIASETDETTEKQRIRFENVSDAMYGIVKDAGLRNARVYRQYCPMAFNDKGAYWLSSEEKIRNPYFGKKMLSCGEVTETID